ncbi:anthranilate phosphoribosyltransferase [Paenibacillus puldeungensis]|uniref:Anthranilate phosphoribosyltransferase n=1 Tax=Paenibacillus puldeungensis TaxID=696536 RepID=A0ABW3S024_9BACL
MLMSDILKEVGRGKRGARDLTYEEARAAATAIINGDASQAQIGAFLMAQRIKMESVDELKAFVDVLRSSAFRSPVSEGLDCAGPYDGRTTTFMATLATAFLLASAGLPVTLHGTAPLPPKWGVTLPDVLREMGVDTTEAPERLASSARSIEYGGVKFVPAEASCPPLGRLRPIREELGLRTILNTAEKLIDYSESPYLVFGVFHNTVFDRMAQLIQRLEYRKALIVQGPQGSEDVYIDRPTRTYRIDGGEAKLHVIDPEAYGLDTPLPSAKDTVWSASDQLQITEQVLRGEAHPAFVNQVMLSGAVRLELAGRVDSVEEGIYTCKALLDSGKPWHLYCHWRVSALAVRC